MKPPRRSRRVLSGDEVWLWGEIAKLITPLRGKAVPKVLPKVLPKVSTKILPDTTPKAPQPPAPVRPVRAPAPEPVARQAVPTGAPTGSRPVKLADLAPGAPKTTWVALRPASPLSPGLERKERRALERGNLAIEARIDLHGMYQAEAHAALIGFITRARAAGHARVLVVTGKGGEGGGIASERGVLRRSVPHWLRGPDLRGFVLGFEEAGRRHGGAGALYVRLRRR